MKLISFRARKVHGYMDFDVRFNDRLTFLVGLNGSGKTTIVRSVHALIDPRLSILVTTAHKSMELVAQTDSERVTVSSSTNDKEGTTLKVSGVTEPLTIAPFALPTGEPSYRTDEFEKKYLEELSVRFASHPVVQRLARLATPMYLGLERRAAVDRVAEQWALYRPYRPMPGSRTVFGGSMTDSVGQATGLATWQHQTALQSENRAADELRRRFIRAAFEFVESSSPKDWFAKFPSSGERKDIMGRKQSILATLSMLDSDSSEIVSTADKYFSQLNTMFEHLPATGSINNSLANEKLPARQRAAVSEWMFNKWQYDRIVKIIRDIDIFIGKRRDAYASLDSYREAVNGFLGETGKEILVGPPGLRVRIRNNEERPVSALSSGEQQIVVLLTHLALNSTAKRAGVLIIDEPELSLHISWQQKFADAVLKTDPKLQVILATHSPTIILDRVDDCVEL